MRCKDRGVKRTGILSTQRINTILLLLVGVASVAQICAVTVMV